MHEREGDRAGKKSFLRKPKHHGRVFADGIQHHRIGRSCLNFA
jgi:hypothetical protein